MTLYRYHIKKITRVQICHLRQLLRIKWEDRLPDVELLSRAGTISVEAQITSARLRWTGHIRMPPTRLVRELSYGELCQTKRRRGASRLQYKYVVKRDTKICEIDSAKLESAGSKHRAYLRKAKTQIPKKRREAYSKAHQARQTVPIQSAFVCDSCGRYCTGLSQCPASKNVQWGVWLLTLYEKNRSKIFLNNVNVFAGHYDNHVGLRLDYLSSRKPVNSKCKRYSHHWNQWTTDEDVIWWCFLLSNDTQYLFYMLYDNNRKRRYEIIFRYQVSWIIKFDIQYGCSSVKGGPWLIIGQWALWLAAGLVPKWTVQS